MRDAGDSAAADQLTVVLNWSTRRAARVAP
jgi:hypothetical protein